MSAAQRTHRGRPRRRARHRRATRQDQSATPARARDRARYWAGQAAIAAGPGVVWATGGSRAVRRCAAAQMCMTGCAAAVKTRRASDRLGLPCCLSCRDWGLSASVSRGRRELNFVGCRRAKPLLEENKVATMS